MSHGINRLPEVTGDTPPKKQFKSSLIGTSMALTGEPSHVNAMFTGPGRYLRWPLSKIQAFLDKKPELRVTLQSLMNHDLARKLQGMLAT
jgi:hypothetical protein